MMGSFPWNWSMMGRAGYGFGFPWFTLLPLLFIWSLIWKGLSLWQAAKRDQKGWFVVFLILNTAGIVELFYLIFVVQFFSQKKRKPESSPKKKPGKNS